MFLKEYLFWNNYNKDFALLCTTAQRGHLKEGGNVLAFARIFTQFKILTSNMETTYTNQYYMHT